MYFQHFYMSVQGLSTVIEKCKAGHVCVGDHLALCSIPCSTLRAMGIPTCWCCLKRFWNRWIPWFTETLNMMFGSDPNGVSSRIRQICSFCRLCEVKPSWRTDASGSLGLVWFSSRGSVGRFRAWAPGLHFYCIKKVILLVYLNLTVYYCFCIYRSAKTRFLYCCWHAILHWR